jgi:2-aminoethylphosphonate-pyruvate transaminase
MAIPTLTAFSPSFNGPEGQEDMPWLMTAGPVVTSREVKLAMLADWSVRDAEFISMTLRVTEQLLQVLNAGDLYDCIPVNFSGMAALESVLGALAPSGRKRQSLVAATGPGAAESAGILEYLRRPHQVLNVQTGKPASVRGLQRALDANPDIATVLLAQLDVTTGLVSPVADLAAAARAAGKSVVVDARHGVGALPLDLSAGHIDALVTVPWAALGSVPGFSLIVVRRDLLGAKLASSPSAALDLFELWNSVHRTGRFPGTPPSQVVSACSAALRELDLEGGPEVRLARFRRVHDRLLAGMSKLGFQPAINGGEAACGFLTLFSAPADPAYAYTPFAQRLRQQGFVIMDGEACPAPAGSFRVATMGHMDDDTADKFIEAVEKVMRDMGLRSGKPA